MRTVFIALVPLGLVAGCVGRFDYAPPLGGGTPAHWRVVAGSSADVWRQVSAGVGWERFVIDEVDSPAGVVTLTYSGDPERYVDCGYITSSVQNARGKRTYRFPAATASTEYELMTGKEIVAIARRTQLDARIAVTLIPLGSNATRVSTTTRYVLSRTILIRDTQGRSQTISHLIRFTSDRGEAFPGVIACRPTGTLEADVLSAFAP